LHRRRRGRLWRRRCRYFHLWLGRFFFDLGLGFRFNLRFGFGFDDRRRRLSRDHFGRGGFLWYIDSDDVVCLRRSSLASVWSKYTKLSAEPVSQAVLNGV
jgi:hypothetical protein